MIRPARVMRLLLLLAATCAAADAVAHRLLRGPRWVPDHRLGTDGPAGDAGPSGPGSSR